MKPYPFDLLNHLTTPVVIKNLSKNVHFYSVRMPLEAYSINIICWNIYSQCKNDGVCILNRLFLYIGAGLLESRQETITQGQRHVVNAQAISS
jgi:hypothetical protein